MSTSTRSPAVAKDAPERDDVTVPDISLIDDGHEYESSGMPAWIIRSIIGICLIAVLGGGGWALYSYVGGPSEAKSNDVPVHTVQLENMVVEVTEMGALESAENLDIKCEVAGGTTVLWIIEDGEQVVEGQELVRLDDSSLREEVTQQEIVVERARSTKIQAEKNVEVAKINVREYEEGTFVQELQTLESQVVVAEENLRSARNALEHTQRMFRKGYATQLELEAQKFAVRRGELDLASAETARDVLKNFTKEKMLEDLKSQVATAEASLSSERKALELEEMKLERFKVQLTKCVITAPKSGMVVYANEQGWRGNDEVQIGEGAAIRERQTILRLPELSKMQVKVAVHENKVENLVPGMRANVKVLDTTLQGTVTTIANQPAQTSKWFGSAAKKYDTVIAIDDSSRGSLDLKPGMTAEATILIENLTDQVAVPRAAVYEGHVWVQEDSGKFDMRKVTLGPMNVTYAAIQEGLAVGDVVATNIKSFKADIAKLNRDRPELSAEERFGAGAPTELSSGAGREQGGQGRESRGRGGQGGGDQGRGFGAQSALSGLDANSDGVITRDELSSMPFADKFDEMDSNGDGEISMTELSAAMKAFAGSNK
ncbi:MAG: HlyD family efflux transporter periplasmic adaptor subunit [Pirellulales bacterium]|nr:HlyD family efflux transporter periplasmic adaptor subunit [Pirellulales bacterium]